MGNKKITVQNLEIVRVDAENNLLLEKGSVPGPTVDVNVAYFKYNSSFNYNYGTQASVSGQTQQSLDRKSVV